VLSPQALVPLMTYLRGLGAAPVDPEPVLDATERLLADYRGWLLAERG
jgi:hypothetical protein